jgi:hypothetical protein
VATRRIHYEIEPMTLGNMRELAAELARFQKGRHGGRSAEPL